MDAQQFANEVAAKLTAIGMAAVATSWDAKDADGNLIEPGAYVVTPTSSEWHDIPLGPTDTTPGGFMTGVSPSLISPLASQSGYTPEAWAIAYYNRAKELVGVLKAMFPTLGQGVYVDGHWYEKQSDVPTAGAPPAPYVPPPLKPGGHPSPFGPLNPPDSGPAVTPDKVAVQKWFEEGKALFGL